MELSQWRRRMVVGAGAAVLGVPVGRALATTKDQIINIGFAAGFGAKLLPNFSASVRDGALMAIEEANRRKPMIGGKPIRFELMVADDQDDPQFARIAARSLIAANVCAVVGHTTTAASIAASPIYAEAGIPMITPLATGRVVTSRALGNVFQLLGNSENTSNYLAEALKQPIGSTRLAILDNGTPLGQELAANLIRYAELNGVALVARETVGAKSSDFTAAFTRLKAANPDVVFFTAIGPQVPAMLQHAKLTGLNCTWVGSGGSVNPEFPATGPFPAGAYVLMHGQPIDKRRATSDFEREFRRKYESGVTAYTTFSYDAVGMLTEAIRRIDGTQPQALCTELHAMRYNGISGPVSFNADGSQSRPPYTLYKATRDQWQVARSFGG